MTAQELDQILSVLKKHGVIQAKIGDFEVAIAPTMAEQKISDEELLFAHNGS
jgi:hypothetical protein